MIRGAAAVLAVTFGLAAGAASFLGSGFLLVLFFTLFCAAILAGRRQTRKARP